jgi:hypothetical protein
MITLEIAKALKYLLMSASKDIKVVNILLDDSLTTKLFIDRNKCT